MTPLFEISFSGKKTEITKSLLWHKSYFDRPLNGHPAALVVRAVIGGPDVANSSPNLWDDRDCVVWLYLSVSVYNP